MERNQIDLLLLLSFLLVGSLFYTKNLKKELAIIKNHCLKAQTENRSTLGASQFKLRSFAQAYPLYKDEITTGIEKINKNLLYANFSVNENKKLQKVYQELIKLEPFKNLDNKNIKIGEQLCAQTIETGIAFFEELNKKKEPSLAFSILLESMESKGNNLSLEIKPFNRYNFSKEALLALTERDSFLIEGPHFAYCQDLKKTRFVSKNKKGEISPIKTIYSINSRP